MQPLAFRGVGRSMGKLFIAVLAVGVALLIALSAYIISL